MRRQLLRINLIIIVIFLSFMAMKGQAQEVQPVINKHPLLAQQVPNFTLNDLEGNALELDSFRGDQKTLLYFWATWCVNCHEKLQFFNEDKALFEERGMRLLMVNSGESRDKVLQYVQRQGLDLPMVLDEESSLDEAYAIEGLPTIVFVNAQGVVMNVTHSLPH